MKTNQLHNYFLKSTGVCTDTRKLKKGNLFFALKGTSFNGNEYALKAIEKGASYAVVDDVSLTGDQLILVDDVLQALQDLAFFHRKYLGIPIIALTGSNGKTTTKELIYAVLSEKYNCVATVGNFNNHIGVPLTLLSMDSTTEIGVVEMGANHLNEIDFLCAIASPNYGYITNIGKAHLEGFGSEENILIGKTELYRFLKANKGVVIGNAEDVLLVDKSKTIEHFYFSETDKEAYQIKLLSYQPFVKVVCNQQEIMSNLIGEYNFTNIAASIAFGLYFEVDIQAIKKAIEAYVSNNNRSQIVLRQTNELILDAYNANPSSMKAALINFENLESNQQNLVVILGDMFELGEYAKKEHQMIVDYLLSSKISRVLLAGVNFKNTHIKDSKIKAFSTTENLIDYLIANKIDNSKILIKGSRGMALEKVVDYL